MLKREKRKKLIAKDRKRKISALSRKSRSARSGMKANSSRPRHSNKKPFKKSRSKNRRKSRSRTLLKRLSSPHNNGSSKMMTRMTRFTNSSSHTSKCKRVAVTELLSKRRES